ncbi:MAG: hypothetical protein ABIG70_04920 [Pseudomonadota bacterium]
MDWEKDYPPALTAEEYRKWMVMAFHDKIWQNAIYLRSLSTEQYVKQIARGMGRDWLSDMLRYIKEYIILFEKDADSIRAETAIAMNLEFFRDAEKRLLSVVRYSIDHGGFKGNEQNIIVTRGHPVESFTTVDRDPESHDLLSSKTVYKFD